MRRCIARFAHQDGLKQYGRGERAYERQGQQFAHARRAWMARKTQTAKGGGRRQRGVDDSPGEAGLKEMRLP